MRKLIKSFCSISAIIFFIAVNFTVFNATTFALPPDNDWIVTCHYNNFGTLMGWDCTSGGTHECGGCPS